jgi:Na+-driven multidrug efflux pump
MAIKEQQHPFYKPLWRRVVIVLTVAIWLGVELYMGERGIWAALAGGMLAYAIYIFFLTWPKDEPKDDGVPPA